MWIAEGRSRFDGSPGHASVESFLAVCAQLGFKPKGKPDESNKMFFIVQLVKDKDYFSAASKVTKKKETAAANQKKGGGDARGGKLEGLKWPKLKPCIYKRR